MTISRIVVMADLTPTIVATIVATIMMTILVTIVATMGGCTWVETRPGAERIMIAEPGEVADCTRQGTTRASVRDRVMGVQRKPGKVAEEIETLARTSAMEMGGNALVPIGPVRDGAREFIVYKCP